MLKLFKNNIITPNYYTINTDKDIKKFRVISVPDLHVHNNAEYIIILNKFTEYLRMMIPNPDYILIPGDGIDSISPENVHLFLTFLEEISKQVAPVYYTLDIHDYHSMINGKEEIERENLKSFLESLKSLTNVKTFFPNEPAEKCILRDNVCLVGYSLPVDIEHDSKSYVYEPSDQTKKFRELKAYLELLNLSSKNFNMLQYHNPEVFYNNGELVSIKNYLGIALELIVSGHMHNCMNLDLPFFRTIMGNRGLLDPSKHLFPYNIYGSHEKDGTTSITSKSMIKTPATVGQLLYQTNRLYKKSHFDVIDIKCNK